jgi:hypothetical protein
MLVRSITDSRQRFGPYSPDSKFDKQQMACWGLALAWREHFPESNLIFKFITALFPDMAHLSDDLADAYAKNGRRI